MGSRVLVFAEAALAASETFIANHCRSLSRYDHTFVAFERRADEHPDVARTIIAAGGSYLRWQRLLFRLGLDKRVDRLIAQLKPDIIHAHYLMGGAFILPYAQRAGIPLVTTGHGYDVMRRLDLFSSYSMAYRLRRLGLKRHCALTLPVSDYLRRKLVTAGFPENRLQVHYLGIPLESDPPAPVVQSPQRIVYAGRLVENKGIDRVLDAFAIIRNTMPGAELHIAGDGPLRGLVEKSAREIGAITVHGALPHPKILELMAGARVFTMPSREASDGASEGFGLVLIEAQSLGIPVVTSNQTGAAEAVVHGETGLCVNSNNAAALAKAYVQFLGNAEFAARIGEAGYRFVRRNFDINIQTAKLEKIYDDLIAANSIQGID